MSIFIDIIGATIIGAMVILAIFGVMTNMNAANYERTFTLNVQTNTVTFARLVEHDLVKIGYHVSKPAIFSADSVSISFKADLYDVGDSNLVSYYMSDVTAPGVVTSRNPRDRILYRVVDGQPLAANLGLVDLRFTYLDSSGSVTVVPAEVRAIRVKARFESPEPLKSNLESQFSSDSTYLGAFWEKTIYPRNLQGE